MATTLIRGLLNIRSRHQGCVITIGNFDGIHLGHQALLKKVKATAEELQIPSCVVTFEPHPMEFFLKEKVAPRLMRLREKFTAIAEFGIDQVVVLHFNAHLANLSAENFIKLVLIDKLQAKQIIVGEDFHFGKKRTGDIELLKQAGFTAEGMLGVSLDRERISSSRVREALALGDHALVERLLGRPYTMMGRIVHGDKRGRIIGFPTANIYLHRTATPVQGVYTVRMHGITDKPLLGVANVGIRPTIGGTRSLLEVHLFDFNQDIYGRYVRVEFCKKLRNEERYANLDLLKQQILKDAEKAREYFANESNEKG